MTRPADTKHAAYWDLRDIKGSFKRVCEMIERGWDREDKAPEGYEPGETSLLVYLEDNARNGRGRLAGYCRRKRLKGYG